MFHLSFDHILTSTLDIDTSSCHCVMSLSVLRQPLSSVKGFVDPFLNHSVRKFNVTYPHTSLALLIICVSHLFVLFLFL